MIQKYTLSRYHIFNVIAGHETEVPQAKLQNGEVLQEDVGQGEDENEEEEAFQEATETSNSLI